MLVVNYEYRLVYNKSVSLVLVCKQNPPTRDITIISPLLFLTPENYIIHLVILSWFFFSPLNFKHFLTPFPLLFLVFNLKSYRDEGLLFTVDGVRDISPCNWRTAPKTVLKGVGFLSYHHVMWFPAYELQHWEYRMI